ncbi:MAG TPA: hypothetical protein VHY22_09785 [Chthoniobacteraceae bacterium]|jgi:hypothetical protein|nr:hypothetical protein [Chthoniobacteraceae bacterium]
MSLSEVQEAVTSLSRAEQEELFRLLALRLRTEPAEASSSKNPVDGKEKRAIPEIDLLERLRKIFPNGPVKGDIQDVIDYGRDAS